MLLLAEANSHTIIGYSVQGDRSLLETLLHHVKCHMDIVYEYDRAEDIARAAPLLIDHKQHNQQVTIQKTSGYWLTTINMV